MARSMWSGTLGFGLVNVPIKMFTARTPKTIRFKQLNSKTGALVKQKRVDASTSDEVDYENIVKGYELGPDRYVIVSPEELDSLAPEKTKRIEIERFVDPSEIDPMLYDAHYYLGPNAGGAKAYKMLADAVASTGLVAVGRVVIRSREQVVALSVLPNGTFRMSTLMFADEVNSPDEFPTLDGTPSEVSAAEQKMAVQLVKTLAGDFNASEYHDEYRDQVLDLIERKVAGLPPVEQPDRAEPVGVESIMAALEASLEAAKPAKKPAAKKPAKKAARA